MLFIFYHKKQRGIGRHIPYKGSREACVLSFFEIIVLTITCASLPYNCSHKKTQPVWLLWVVWVPLVLRYGRTVQKLPAKKVALWLGRWQYGVNITICLPCIPVLYTYRSFLHGRLLEKQFYRIQTLKISKVWEEEEEVGPSSFIVI